MFRVLPERRSECGGETSRLFDAKGQGRTRVSESPQDQKESEAAVLVLPYLLSTGFLQQNPQAARVPLVVGHQLPQRGEGDLVGHEVGADGRALDAEVEDLPLAASCEETS